MTLDPRNPLERDRKGHILWSNRASVVRTHAPLSVRRPDDCRPRKRHGTGNKVKSLVCSTNGFAVKMPNVLNTRSPLSGANTNDRQTPPCQNAHLRTARRVWRMVVLATQTPPTRVLPGPQPKATYVIMLSGCGISAGVIASAEVATANAKPAIAIHLIILVLLLARNFLFNSGFADSVSLAPTIMTPRRFPPPWSAVRGGDINDAVIALRLVLQLGTGAVPSQRTGARVCLFRGRAEPEIAARRTRYNLPRRYSLAPAHSANAIRMPNAM